MIYFWTKTFHLLFAIAWMAAVFYLPRILVNLAEAGADEAVRQRLRLMGRRLYRFGHIMFGLALALGLILWQGWRLFPQTLPDVVADRHWIDAKLALVALMLIFFIVSGRMLKRDTPPSATWLRLFNELPVLVVLLIIYLVLAKPF